MNRKGTQRLLNLMKAFPGESHTGTAAPLAGDRKVSSSSSSRITKPVAALYWAAFFYDSFVPGDRQSSSNPTALMVTQACVDRIPLPLAAIRSPPYLGGAVRKCTDPPGPRL